MWMFNKRFSCLVIPLVVILFMLAGCGEKATQVLPVNTIAGARETEVFLTVVVQLTQEAAAFTQTPAPLPPPTAEIILPTSTPLPPTVTAVPVASTPTPQGTPTPRTETSDLRIWQDDFEGGKNWYTGTKEDSYTFEFINGAYRIYNNLFGSIVWSIRGESYTDVRLEVDAMKQKGPKDGYFGLICRYVDPKNYYALAIGGDNTVRIVKQEESKLSFIQQAELPANILNDKTEYNHLRADCIGSSLTLYVNDNKVIEAQDSNFTSGDVGIGAGNQLEATGIDVVFDNFEIWQP